MKNIIPAPEPFQYTRLQKSKDIMVSLRGIWLIILFNVLAVFAFWGVPQGTDVLLCITEDVAGGINVFPLIWLMVALFFWSIASEFCTRFTIYLTDNSGRSLAPARVEFRKAAQRFIAKIFLFLPVVVMMAAFLKAWFFNIRDLYTANINLAFITILFILAVMAFILYLLYIRGGIKDFAHKHKAFSWLIISKKESYWVNKLYGFLNDVRVDVPADISTGTNDLPRNIRLANGMELPNEFIPYENNPVKDGNLHVWMFRIPLSFYPNLRKQLRMLFALSIVFIIVFSFLPVNAYASFGAASLICLAFGCWQVVYIMLHYLDKAQRFFPLRLTLLVLFLISSFYNRDHEIRSIGKQSMETMTLGHHFESWYSSLVSDTIMGGLKEKIYRVGARKDSVPVVFIAAEGGALRTGAFTSMILSQLADAFPSFPAYIYCYSGVSGGTLGSNFFNSIYIDHQLNHNGKEYSQATQNFFTQDYLSAVTGKLVFGEIVNYFIPWRIKAFDRAIALEQAWEQGWEKSNGQPNLLEGSFNISKNNRTPAIFINTTEAESGLQCIWSNVVIDTMTLGRQRDLAKRTGLEISYSTAINLSTRFPLISPGATIFYTGSHNNIERKHFVDGGYFENTGAETLLEVMKLVNLQNKPIKPYVIQFNFADEDTITSTSIKKFSEVMEIVGAIYNTRSGRSHLSQAYLQRYVDSLGGVFIALHMKLNTKKFPMNWMLSNTAMNRLDSVISTMIKPRITDTTDLVDKENLHRLFVYED